MRQFGPILVVAIVAAACSQKPVETSIPPGQIIGHVELSEELPASECFVSVQGIPLSARCDSDGNFELKGVPPGKWQLRIFKTKQDKAPLRKVLAGANSGVVGSVGSVRIAKPGAIGGRLKGNADTAAIVTVNELGLAVGPSEVGGFLLNDVPPGKHEVVLLASTGVIVTAPVEVLPGTVTAPVDFDLTKTTPSADVKLSGTVVAAQPDLMPGITVKLIECVNGTVVAQMPVTESGSWQMNAKAGVYIVTAQAANGLIAASVYTAVGHRDLDVGALYLAKAEGDLDADGTPNASDPDSDGDGVLNEADAFPMDPLESQDSDGDGVGDRSDLKSKAGAGIDSRPATPDSDGDGLFDFMDNCPNKPNTAQEDNDGDGVGDLCDNCPYVENPDQHSSNDAGVGDACPVCDPVSCAELNKNCGLIPNGCGAVIDCGSCTAPQTCGGAGNPNVCGDPSSSCAPTSCAALNKNCGLIPDGCGRVLDCGSCAAPETCGGGGNPNICGAQANNCTPTSCAALNKNCGLIPDGCGRVLDCGNCASPETCGGGGVANRCGVQCFPTTCAFLGKNCGTLNDGCGRTLNCGSGCDAGSACLENVCTPQCTPQSCAQQGKDCGLINDGCGNQLNCGGCSVAGQVCGGDPTKPNVCATPTGCTPTTCAAAGKDCGSMQDGCGGTLNCGSCTYPQICGAQGTPNKCQQCPTLQTCTALGKNCGYIDDGCGQTSFCGSCTAPQTCGGAGVANVCGLGTHTLNLVSGANQSALINQSTAAAITAQVTNNANGQPVANLPMQYIAPLGAASSPSDAGFTNPSGQAVVVPIMGRVAGTYSYQLIAQGGGALTVPQTAVSPDAGVIIPIINTAGFSGVPANNTPAVLQRLSTVVGGIASAADGTLYVSDTNNHLVVKVSPAGVLTRIAGGGTAAGPGFGDYGPATSAVLLKPTGLALDEVNQRLYVSDSQHDRVRVIDLSSPNGFILPFAGNGAQGTRPYGDNGPANSANLYAPSFLTLGVGSDNALYITDSGHNIIRRVELGTTLISTYMHSTQSNLGVQTTSNTPHLINSCNNPSAGSVGFTCAVVFDVLGNAFIAGQFSGTATAGVQYLVIRRSADGTTKTVVGGGATLPGTDGVVASALDYPTTASQAPVGAVALDQAGNLFYSEPLYHRIRRVDSLTGRVSTLIGDGTAQHVGNFAHGSAGRADTPLSLAMDAAGNLYFADNGNSAVRMAAKVGTSTVRTATIAVKSGNNPSGLRVGEPHSLVAEVRDSSNALLTGTTVTFASDDSSAWTSKPTTVTNGLGEASTGIRSGFIPGSYSWTAKVFDYLHAPPAAQLTFTVPVNAPAPGTLLTLVNAGGAPGTQIGVPGAAVAARVGNVGGLAFVNTGWTGSAGQTSLAPGTLFLTDRGSHTVLMVTPGGRISVVAGIPGTSGNAGDGSPGASVTLDSPKGLVLDEQARRLYVSTGTTTNGRVRYIDLSMPDFVVNTYVGGGTQSPGDGLVANQVLLRAPNHLAINPSDRSLWIGETGSGTYGSRRIRRVDAVTDVITTVLFDPASASPTAIEFDGCGVTSNQLDGCALAFRGGDVYIGGLWQSPGENSHYKIVKRNLSTGAMTTVVGKYLAANTDGLAPTNYGISTLTDLAFDASGRLYWGEAANCRIKRVDLGATSPVVETVMGSTCGFSGDYQVGPGQMSGATEIDFAPGNHLTAAEFANGVVRQLY